VQYPPAKMPKKLGITTVHWSSMYPYIVQTTQFTKRERNGRSGKLCTLLATEILRAVHIAAICIQINKIGPANRKNIPNNIFSMTSCTIAGSCCDGRNKNNRVESAERRGCGCVKKRVRFICGLNECIDAVY